jgi:hypothetical protein
MARSIHRSKKEFMSGGNLGCGSQGNTRRSDQGQRDFLVVAESFALFFSATRSTPASRHRVVPMRKDAASVLEMDADLGAGVTQDLTLKKHSVLSPSELLSGAYPGEEAW